MQTPCFDLEAAFLSQEAKSSIQACLPPAGTCNPLVFSLYSERSRKRFYLFNSGAFWNQHYRLQKTASISPWMSFQLAFFCCPCFASSLFSVISGGLFYTIFKELFSSSSPSKIYGRALEKCRSHPEVSSQDWVTWTLMSWEEEVGRIQEPVLTLVKFT